MCSILERSRDAGSDRSAPHHIDGLLSIDHIAHTEDIESRERPAPARRPLTIVASPITTATW